MYDSCDWDNNTYDYYDNGNRNMHIDKFSWSGNSYCQPQPLVDHKWCRNLENEEREQESDGESYYYSLRW